MTTSIGETAAQLLFRSAHIRAKSGITVLRPVPAAPFLCLKIMEVAHPAGLEVCASNNDFEFIDARDARRTLLAEKACGPCLGGSRRGVKRFGRSFRFAAWHKLEQLSPRHNTELLRNASRP
jgi:hypothetical protein